MRITSEQHIFVKCKVQDMINRYFLVYLFIIIHHKNILIYLTTFGLETTFRK